MDDIRQSIFKQSFRIITKLQLLSVFFEEEIIYKIYVRTQVIQNLFENDPELDINKLDLFHLQYTETVIELLRKIKKANEKNVNISQDEIRYNEELIGKINEAMRTEENFENAALAQTTRVNKSLFKMYQNLSGYSPEPPFPKEIGAFSEKYAKEFFTEIAPELFDELLEFDPGEVYKNGYGIIEKKLMGWQCKRDFKNVFVCGVKAGEISIEIYKLDTKDDYFIFYPPRHLFLDLAYSKIENLNRTTPLSKQEKIVRDLSEKNVSLKNNITAVKTNIPPDIQLLLNDYYQKIASLDFINDDFDIQANILKTMINTKDI